MSKKVDVLVVGGGPAGCMAALTAAQAGAGVLLIDRRRRLGALPHCAEFVPQALALELDPPPRSRVQRTTAMELRVGDEAHVQEAPGWILDRQVFDHGLAEAAAQAGAEVWACAELLRWHGHEAEIHQGGQTVRVACGAAVGADGAASGLARVLGHGPQRLMAAVQREVPLPRPLGHTLVFLAREYRHGYAWLFPKGRVANLGLGADRPSGLPGLLEALHQRLAGEGVVGPGWLATGGGAIPVSGPREPLFRHGVFLAGDAAGLTHPVTGAGIPQALDSGRAAGTCAARHAGGDRGAANDYAAEVGGRWAKHLGRGLAARQAMEQAWNGLDFTAAVAHGWPFLAARQTSDTD